MLFELWLWLGLGTLLTSCLSGAVGMAGGITLLSFMSFFTPYRLLIPIHGFIQLSSNASRTFFLRKKVKLSLFLPFAIGTPFGAFASLQLLKNIQDPRPFLGLIIILILYTLFKPKKLPSLKLNSFGFWGLGAVSGFFSLLIGATGPLLATFFLRDDLTKEEVVATKAASQLFIHLLKIPAFLHLGFAYDEYLLPLCLMGLAAVLGSKLGVLILDKVEEKKFILIYKSFLAISAMRLAYVIFVSS